MFKGVSNTVRSSINGILFVVNVNVKYIKTSITHKKVDFVDIV